MRKKRRSFCDFTVETAGMGSHKSTELLQTKGCPKLWLTVAMESCRFTASAKARESNPPVNQWLPSTEPGPGRHRRTYRRKMWDWSGYSPHVGITVWTNKRSDENDLEEAITCSNQSDASVMPQRKVSGDSGCSWAAASHTSFWVHVPSSFPV